MSTIWDDSGYPFSTDRLPVRRVVLRGRYRGKPKSEAKEAGNQNVAPASGIRTDAAGSPSESRCSASHLANILAVRDELEAQKLRAK